MYYFVMNAVAVRADFSYIEAGNDFQFSCVESRMILWCIAGTGKVKINGTVHVLSPGRYFFLPWGHAIRYMADGRYPLHLGGVHLIPHHDVGRSVDFTVSHRADHPLAGVHFRRDAGLTNLAGLKTGWLNSETPLSHLLVYAVRLFLARTPSEQTARTLASQLLGELTWMESRREAYSHETPSELERMKTYIRGNLRRPLSLSDLVEFTGLSASSIGRMFQRHLSTTPVNWILQTKMEQAKALLRTRRLSIAEIGEQVGIADPYYFSKCFKSRTGQSPQQYRQSGLWI